MEPMKIAYTLLPPPLSALPAKYWTSISLWLHSYTVARTFQELARLAEVDKEVNSDDLFILGFLHDLGQKLDKTPDALRTAHKWVYEKLTNELGYSPNEARHFGKTLETNPAETVEDPAYPKVLRKLLSLADRLQGGSDALSWALEAKKTLEAETGRSFSISLYSITLPQPFVKTRIWDVVEEKLPNDEALPIASMQGLLVISKNPTTPITISWDEIVGRDGNGDTEVLSAIDIKILDNYVKNVCCKKPKKDKRNNGSIENEQEDNAEKRGNDGNEETEKSKFMSFASKYCKPRKNERAGSYRLLLHYYGRNKDEELANLYLPPYFKNSITGIEVTDVEYKDGEFLCPICGARHSEGFVTGLMGSVTGKRKQVKVKSEKWNRFLTVSMNKNLNRMLAESGSIRVCPLCMLDLLLSSKHTFDNYSVYYTFSSRVPVPVFVLHEIAGLMHAIIGKFYETSGKSPQANIGNLETMTKSPIDFIDSVGRAYSGILHDYSGVSISANGGVAFYGSLEDLKFDEKLTIASVAGLLAYYGIYPITITIGHPPKFAPADDALLSYEISFPLYNYAPRNEEKIYGKPITPYVSSVLAYLPKLYWERENPETRRFARHIEEILGFTPLHAPLMLLYSDPNLYSRVSYLLSRFIGVR